ncbi:MAG: presenilin family intramembrane aspartyl protease PSH [Candidatus Poseidoniaceae archaeon]|jgi:presenilin-like A22 family membrane protease|nr:presenilin family intramembrane aspartyl protease PSH [Candidatus Poseidoniaceae archaeon]
MSEQSTGESSENEVSQEFARIEKELTKETSVISLMKEQMKSMVGMVSMFIITIVISLFIRPWYDVAELHAFGEAGSTQVRYIALELVMIFIFTACVIMLARYKKEWLIKYGILGVLTIALMYTTVPLAHMFVIDFDVEDFEYTDSFESDQTYLTDIGMGAFITHDLIGNSTNWQDSVSYWNQDSMVSGTPEWTYNQERLPAGDSQIFRVVKSPTHLTLTNGAWVSSVDINTGELIETYACHSEENGVITLGTDYSFCDMAVIVEGGVYTFSTGGDLVFYRTFEGSPGVMAYQSKWGLPPNIDIRNEFIDATMIEDERMLLVTKSSALVLHLEENSGTLDIDLQKIIFQYDSSSSITTVDFGHSPWSENNISSNKGDEGLLIIGEQDGTITGWEWQDNLPNDEGAFTVQDKMNLENFVDSVQSVQITDLDESGLTDLLITSDDTSYWLHTTLLKNKISFPVGENFSMGIFGSDANDSVQFYSVNSNQELSIDNGEITDDMFALEGLQLYDTPFLIGILVALALMVLLYAHSEWYVVNTVGVLVGAGVIVMLGVAFVPTLIIIFMVLAAVYDAWAVYKSKHMLELADTMIGLQLPILLVAPQDKGYSFRDEKAPISSKDGSEKPEPTVPKAKPKKNKEAMFMGLGDVIFPGMLVLSAVQWLDTDYGLSVAICTLIGGLLGYTALMTYVARGKAQAGLPLLNGGAILGYFVGGLIFAGTAIFELGITW